MHQNVPRSGPPEIIVRYCWENEKADRFEVQQPVHFQLTGGRSVTIPVGYKTDFASVPAILWGFIPSIGRHNHAALVHDYLYDNRLFEEELGPFQARLFADQEFLRIANEIGPTHRLRHLIMYRFVRWFGLSWWVQ
ncbi:DUF1353 domain-containing protein [uncultured Fibrella sp.]|uniref:DUF1353 domain-containing protein n=1 Tax=uncultured Fibrella sp. TaxID=1284596 RepID=UPI0035CC725C